MNDLCTAQEVFKSTHEQGKAWAMMDHISRSATARKFEDPRRLSPQGYFAYDAKKSV